MKNIASSKSVAKSVGEVGNALVKNNAISTFSGAGGMDLGFAKAGVKVLAAIEKWTQACCTFRQNFPGTKLFEGDITDGKVKAKIFEFLKGLRIDVIFGGPPCTGYSQLGKRDPNDPCNYLYLDYLELVDKLRPAVFVIENVEGILSMPLKNGLLAIEAIIAKAAKFGYKLEYRILTAADYGVGQLRKRVIIIGTKFDVPILFPEPTHGPAGSGLKPYVTVRDVLGDLETAPEDEAFSHVFTEHSAKMTGRIKATKQGESLYARNHGCRLDPDKPAATLTNNNGSTVVHYGFDRMITPRECARIQGFPDSHLFSGNKNDVGKQVGNALPPALAQAVAESVIKMLDVIKAGAPEVTFPTAIVSASEIKEDLDAEIAKLRKGYIARINGELAKIDVASSRVDSNYGRIGMYADEFISVAKAKGETRGEDYLFKSILKDKDCKVKKGALYNARYYYLLQQAMTEKFGKSPDVPMTYFVKVRHKALTIDEQHELLLMAETDKTLKASMLNAMVAKKLEDKGYGRKAPAPDAELAENCKKALGALTRVSGLLRKGIIASEDSVLLLGKTSKMLAICLKDVGGETIQPIPLQADIGDAIPDRKAS